jgi:uncharacterized protein with HEPN domain
VPSKDPARRFEDTLHNIVLIEEFTVGLNRATFTQDARTTNAVERCLERISEAAKKLADVAETPCPEIPWPKVRALGNLLRHEYDTVDIFRVWLMVEDDLPSLKAAASTAMERLRQQQTGEDSR